MPGLSDMYWLQKLKVSPVFAQHSLSMKVSSRESPQEIRLLALFSYLPVEESDYFIKIYYIFQEYYVWLRDI